MRAGCQDTPPSSLISTDAIPAFPANALPRSGNRHPGTSCVWKSLVKKVVPDRNDETWPPPLLLVEAFYVVIDQLDPRHPFDALFAEQAGVRMRTG